MRKFRLVNCLAMVLFINAPTAFSETLRGEINHGANNIIVSRTNHDVNQGEDSFRCTSTGQSDKHKSAVVEWLRCNHSEPRENVPKNCRISVTQKGFCDATLDVCPEAIYELGTQCTEYDDYTKRCAPVMKACKRLREGEILAIEPEYRNVPAMYRCVLIRNKADVRVLNMFYNVKCDD